jgi:hypothetical protein
MGQALERGERGVEMIATASLMSKRIQGPVHDGEVLAMATLLHDIDKDGVFGGPLRSEVEGANVTGERTIPPPIY